MQRIFIFRMTHIRNIDHILNFGISGSKSPNANSRYIPIGDSLLIKTRDSKTITAIDGTTLCLGDFIPFYFWLRMPMLFVMQRGGNFVPKATPAREIVYLVISIERIIENGNRFYFSDGHPLDHLTKTFTSKYLVQINDLLDWNAIKTNKWSGEGIDRDIKRRKQAEFLVSGSIPADIIDYYICYDSVAENNLVEKGIPKEKIRVLPQYYY